MSCHLFAFDIMIMRMACEGSNVLKLLMHDHDNQGELLALSMEQTSYFRRYAIKQ